MRTFIAYIAGICTVCLALYAVPDTPAMLVPVALEPKCETIYVYRTVRIPAPTPTILPK